MRGKAQRAARHAQMRLQNSGVTGVNVYHHTKFSGDRSNRSWDTAIFLFFKMAAIYHLGPPTNSICRCA